MRSRHLLSRAVATLALALVALIGGAAAPSARADGGVLITPSSVAARVQAGDRLRPVRVTNTTGRDLDVVATGLVARQELSGLPVYGLGPRARRDGRAFVRVRPARFTLRAGRSRAVVATVVARRPQTGRGAYGVILFEAVPRRASAARNAVTARLRLTANLLLTYPSRSRPATALTTATGLRAEQAPARALRLLVRVRGAGTIHGRPAARLRIRDARGRVVGRATFATGNVLPGADRELPAVVARPLPAGRYTARAVVRSGRSVTTVTLPLRLVANGTLPTPDLRIAALPVPQPGSDRAFTAQLELVNRGTAAAPVRGAWQLRSAGGQQLLASGAISGASAVPAGGRRTVELRLPGVSEGRRRLVVTLEGGGRELDRREVVFRAGDGPGRWTRLEDWAAAHVPLVLGGCAALLLAVCVSAAGYTLRLRRRLAATT
ncbi:hypothetical protein DSM112329_03802 [Paraconexibacter sp. AEG42_29]|uniref:CARDB domain-containing protein n=1 Tax=Paraconexibacter sp. AEG42_29 TaxID=2997339 RepID=A0AAU7AZ32_9ACTN